jgi:hypothetical protein
MQVHICRRNYRMEYWLRHNLSASYSAFFAEAHHGRE